KVSCSQKEKPGFEGITDIVLIVLQDNMGCIIYFKKFNRLITIFIHIMLHREAVGFRICYLKDIVAVASIIIFPYFHGRIYANTEKITGITDVDILRSVEMY